MKTNFTISLLLLGLAVAGLVAIGCTDSEITSSDPSVQLVEFDPEDSYQDKDQYWEYECEIDIWAYLYNQWDEEEQGNPTYDPNTGYFTWKWQILLNDGFCSTPTIPSGPYGDDDPFEGIVSATVGMTYNSDVVEFMGAKYTGSAGPENGYEGTFWYDDLEAAPFNQYEDLEVELNASITDRIYFQIKTHDTPPDCGAYGFWNMSWLHWWDNDWTVERQGIQARRQVVWLTFRNKTPYVFPVKPKFGWAPNTPILTHYHCDEDEPYGQVTETTNQYNLVIFGESPYLY